jgi:membrane protein
MARADPTIVPEDRPAEQPALLAKITGPPGPAAGRSVLAAAWARWNESDADAFAGAVAFYTILSLAPLILIVVGVGSWWIGADATRHYLSTHVASLIGREGGALVDRLVYGRDVPLALDGWGAWLAMAVTVVSATAAFAELQLALNRIFGAIERPPLAELLRVRALSIVLVVGTGVLLAASFVASTALTMLVDRGVSDPAVRVGSAVNELFSLVVIAIAFAALLRFLPDRPPRGMQLWIGAVVSAALFTGGKYLIGWYVSRFALGSAYGAAGTIVVLMLWIWFSATVFFAGAVLASVMPTRQRTGVRPNRGALGSATPA